MSFFLLGFFVKDQGTVESDADCSASLLPNLLACFADWCGCSIFS
jgi:hypothetical protein